MMVSKSLAILMAVLVLGTIGCGPAPVDPTDEDGVEVNGAKWHARGCQDFINHMGRTQDDTYTTGFRFHLKGVNPGDQVAAARIRFPSAGSRIETGASLMIEGVLDPSPKPFSQNLRPSQRKPKTKTRIKWDIVANWDPGSKRVPLYYSSPNIAPIINEILKLPDWGEGPEKKSLIITIRDVSKVNAVNYVSFFDHSFGKEKEKCPAVLEIYKSAYDAFLGKEMLGRVTDSSVTINLYSLLDLDLFLEYGQNPHDLKQKTKLLLNQKANKAIETDLIDLKADTPYFYRLAYRKAGDPEFIKGQVRRFHTQRKPGGPFKFSIISDEHIHNTYKLPLNETDRLTYELTLENVGRSEPDFLISCGDFANTEFYTGRNISTLMEAKDRYLLQRKYLNPISHSIPFYLTIGNHEGENGWYYHSNSHQARNLAVFSTQARKELIPNPYPNWFYTGNREKIIEFGLREDYYAFEWGDALILVLNPFWHTRSKAHEAGHYGTQPTYDGWDWTLGKAQYHWLFDTLARSKARWRFVFIHHLTSTTTPKSSKAAPFYGRGGVEVAKFKVAGYPSFEWGGEDEEGRMIFDTKRPGWKHGPIHDMLVKERVNIVFHGHDHLYAKQELDGLIYQECPQPVKSGVMGYETIGAYKTGKRLPNSGHLNVEVGPQGVKVAFIRSDVKDKTINGTVADSYAIR